MNLPRVDSRSHRRARTTRRIVPTVIAAFAIVLAGSLATAQSRKVLGWLTVGGGVGLAVSTIFVRGSRSSCRQPGREGGPEEPPARGGVADPRAVVDGSRGHRVDHRIARAVVRVGSRVAAVSGLPRRR